MIDFFKGFFDSAMRLILSLQWYDLADIIFVALLLYYLIKLLRQTRAFNLMKGIVFVGLVYLVVSTLNMSASTFVFNSLFGDIVLVIILLFQPEFRQAVEGFGRGDFRKLSIFAVKDADQINGAAQKTALAVSKAVTNMSEKRVGALIVFEGKTPLGEILSSGSSVDAAISPVVIENIFFPKAPLHDGAVVIRDNRIHSAGCILPLTQNEVSLELGTRHRAALGMSEHSDALVVVVSEETGSVSVAHKGRLERDVGNGELIEMLSNYLGVDQSGKSLNLRFPRRKK